MNAASQFLFNELKFQLESLKQSVLKLEKEFDQQMEEGSIGNNPVIWIGTDGDTYKTSIPKTDGTILIYDQVNGIYPVEIVNWGKSKGVLNIKIDLGATLSRKGLLGKVPSTSPMWTNNFSKLFHNQQYFNDFNVTLWDTSHVTDMFGMFEGASNFNQDLSQWCVEKIKTISEYFDTGAVAWTLPRPVWGTCPPKERPLKYLNEQGEVVEYTLILGENPIEDAVEVLDWGWINDWDSHSMEHMLTLYSPKLEKVPDDSPKWTTNYSTLFMGATSFNQDISGWDMSHVTNMYGMFTEATSFNQDISNWDVSNVTNMSYVFGMAESFNQDLSTWDTSGVTDMSLMFYAASSFNQDISSWDTSSVTDMSYMFEGAVIFNQDLSSWCVSKIPNKPDSFDDDATAWTKPKPIWGTCPRGEDKK